MSLNRLNFTKDWNDPSDFPTVEMNEEKVRADQQLLHDETKSCINALITSKGKVVKCGEKEITYTAKKKVATYKLV